MKLLKKLSIAAFLFVWVSVTSAQANAALLKFNEASFDVEKGDTFEVEIIVNPGTDQITSVDSYVTYDSSILSAESVAEGDYFPTTLNDLTTGKAYVAGLVDSPSDFKTGTGTIATLTFKALEEGETDLVFDCDDQATVTSKVIKNDINSTNIINCDENGTAVVTVGVGSGPTTDATEEPTPTTKKVTSLPQSGATENMMIAGSLGVLLITVGGIIKFLKPY